MNERRKRLLPWSAAGLAAGVLAGLLSLLGTGAAVARDDVVREAANRVAESQLEASHSPPLLTAAGETVEVRYDIYCLASPAESDVPCDGGGTVFMRAGSAGAFRAVTLRLDASVSQGRYVAEVPADIAGSATGFSYYAVLRDNASGASLMLPAGGASAPHRSLPLGMAVTVDLGSHAFGAVAAASSRLASAAWGSGPGQVGLEEGPQATPAGGSAFDVNSAGTAAVLDEANRRILRFRPGVDGPTVLPLPISGRLADLSVGSDGTLYVLESPGPDTALPVLRVFDPDGRSREMATLAERTASQIRPGPFGPVALEYPSGQWMPIDSNGSPLDATAQQTGGRSARPLAGGGQVVVLRRGTGEIRVAHVPASGAVRSWRILSATPLAEVQLAEPVRNRLVLVFRVYTDAQDEFVVLVLGDSGIVQRLSLAASDWAETAPLSRFRFVGSSLYQLGSTPDRLFVDRYDLEVS